MAPPIDKKQLIEEALNALHEQTGVEATVEPEVHPDERFTADAIVTIKKGPRVWRFNVKVKPWLDRTTIALLKDKIRENLPGWLLVTRQVGVGQADELQKMHLAFLDTAGNAFLDRDELYVLIKGRKKEKVEGIDKPTHFGAAELKVLFAFLCQKGLEAKTHEEIKRVTGAGLATINRFVHILKDTGYIVTLKGQTRRLVRRRELLDQWTLAYPQRLRPKQLIGRFVGPKAGWWMNLDPTPFNAQWGGEMAAARLTNYLKPQTATLYLAGQINNLIVQQRLRRDPRGDVEILKPFWTFQTENDRKDTVPPLLVYADLMATGDDRNIETARMIYERELAGLIEQG